ITLKLRPGMVLEESIKRLLKASSLNGGQNGIHSLPCQPCIDLVEILAVEIRIKKDINSLLDLEGGLSLDFVLS
ncbi:hypothetical protein BGZ92_006674, partial [Podila epicladia]